MGKVLKVLGVVFLVLIVGFVALLIWSHEKGEATQAEFYEAVSSGDPERLLDRMHPDMRDEIDAPVLRVWMQAVSDNLGRFEDLAASNFSTSSRTENGQSVIESEGKVKFEKGDGKSKLTLRDGKVTAFHLTSDALPDPWFQTSPDAASYVASGEEYLTMLLTDRLDEAVSRMHESLLREMPEEKLRSGIAGLRERIGGFVSIAAAEHEFEVKEVPELRLYYDVVCEKTAVRGYVRYQFTPWKGHLVGFDLKIVP